MIEISKAKQYFYIVILYKSVTLLDHFLPDIKKHTLKNLDRSFYYRFQSCVFHGIIINSNQHLD